MTLSPWNARLPIMLTFIMAIATTPGYTQETTGGPSPFCHETDGGFTICPDGNEEWSDILPQFFPDSGSNLYVDQADLDPSLATPESWSTPSCCYMTSAGKLSP